MDAVGDGSQSVVRQRKDLQRPKAIQAFGHTLKSIVVKQQHLKVLHTVYLRAQHLHSIASEVELDEELASLEERILECFNVFILQIKFFDVFNLVSSLNILYELLVRYFTQF